MGKVVAKQWAQAQTSISTATLSFDTIEGGDFLVSGYVVVDASANTGDVNLNVSWTDDVRFEEASSGNLAYNSSSFLNFSQVVHAKPISTVSVGLGGSGVPSGSHVSWYLLIEALSAPEIPGTF